MARYIFSKGEVRIAGDVDLKPVRKRQHVLRSGIIVFSEVAFNKGVAEEDGEDRQKARRSEENRRAA